MMVLLNVTQPTKSDSLLLAAALLSTSRTEEEGGNSLEGPPSCSQRSSDSLDGLRHTSETVWAKPGNTEKVLRITHGLSEIGKGPDACMAVQQKDLLQI